MMYSNKLAVALKVGGRVLRETRGAGSEFEDTVLIPFGSEYSVYVKNMNSVRALVRISIDGQDVTGGHSLVVDANSEVELERFIKNGNMNEGLRLKFIERTEQIENGPRGIKVDDGLMRIEFEFERPKPAMTNWPSNHLYRSYDAARDRFVKGVGSGEYYGDLLGSTLSSTAATKGVTRSLSNTSARSASYSTHDASATMDWMDAEQTREVKASAPLNDKGITVGGSVSTQQFRTITGVVTDGVKHVLVMKLLGKVGEEPVVAPVTTRVKVECPTCGTKNKSGSKFCSECGTGLIDL